MFALVPVATLAISGWFAYMILTSQYGRPHRVPLPSMVTYYGKPGSLLNPAHLNGHTIYYCIDPNSDVIDIVVDGAMFEVSQNWIEEAKRSSTATFVETKQLS